MTLQHTQSSCLSLNRSDVFINVEEEIQTVQSMIEAVVKQCSRKTEDHDLLSFLGTGKKLRARLVVSIGLGIGAPRDNMLKSACAIELMHLASLLHDDIIDNGYLRRKAPAFWVAKGAAGAILMGDFLVIQAIRMLDGLESNQLMSALLHSIDEMCSGELEQELFDKGINYSLDQCISIARRKTGSLFSFSAMACAPIESKMSAALAKSGSDLGAAYQLLDDLIDNIGNEQVSGKTLGTDQLNGKTTAISGRENADVKTVITDLLCNAQDRLRIWPETYVAWQYYINDCLNPVMEKYNINLESV